ncbi:MAG TPA: hypothetical protein VD867_17620 [Burkholderiales bacterium]|nr:hypothetical protein [Burkholderiales bacterium]
MTVLEARRPLAATRVALLCGVITAGLFSATAVYAASPADCAAEADRASREGGTMMRSAAGGALRGATFGAIVGGDKGTGAAVGAVVGTARKGHQKNQTYNQVYDSCMRR